MKHLTSASCRTSCWPKMGSWSKMGLGLIAVAAIGSSSALAQMTPEEAEQIDEGFRLFTEETFDGNGRTCGTCHIPEANYTISPKDIKRLRGQALAEVLASNVPGLENPTLVKKLGLFNVEGGNALDPEAGDPHGPVFRGSMTVGPFASTINAAPAFPPDPQLGWAANGSPNGGFHHGVPDPDADGSTRAFANGAIAQHNTKSLDRILDVDFRFATADELDAMDAFQNWLGRRLVSEDTGQHEFELALMTFNDPRAAKGKELYMSPEASCNVCHVNGGANFRPPLVPAGNGLNISQHSDVDLERFRLSALTGVFIPEDEGIAVDPPGPVFPLEDGAFNIQPVIEAARKDAFFHNHAFTSDIEDASTFYFREPFIGSDIRIALGGLLTGSGFADHIDDLDDFLAFGGPNAIKEMGVFMRSLSAWYGIRDCERLVKETLDRMKWGISPKLPAMHCQFNMDDVRDLLKGAKMKPRPYHYVYIKSLVVQTKLRHALKIKSKRFLKSALRDLRKMRETIATTPEL